MENQPRNHPQQLPLDSKPVCTTAMGPQREPAEIRPNGNTEEIVSGFPNFSPSARLILVVSLFCTSLVALRSPSGLTTSNLSFEDASVFFNFYYGGEKSFTEIFRHYSGYISLWSQFAAWLAAKFPLGIHIALYSVLSLLITTTSCVALGLSGLLRTRFISVAFALTLASLPFNCGLYQYNLTNSQWPALLVFYGLASLLVFRPPRGGALFVLVIATCIFSWTHPYSVLVAPVYIVLLARGKVPRVWPYACILCSLLGYLATFKSGNTHWDNLLDGEVWAAIVESSLSDILMFQYWVSPLPAFWIITAIILILAFSVRRRLPLRPKGADLALLWMIIGSWLVYAVSSKAGTGDADIQVRYYYTQQVALLMILARRGEELLFESRDPKVGSKVAFCLILTMAITTSLVSHSLPGFQVIPDPRSSEALTRIRNAEEAIANDLEAPIVIRSAHERFAINVTVGSQSK